MIALCNLHHKEDIETNSLDIFYKEKREETIMKAYGRRKTSRMTL
jgi:hypothetical protein